MWRLTSIALLAGSAVVGASAQQSTAGASADPRGSEGATSLTGCVRAGQGADSFVLVTGTGDEDRPKATAGDTGTSGASGSAAAPTGTAGQAAVKTTTYQLVPAGQDVDLRQHVGRRVTVKGRLDPGSKKTVATQNTDASPAPNDATPRDASTPVVTTTEATKVQTQRLHVASVAAAGGSCPQ